MLSEIPKIFDRYFVVGFFLPSVLFILAVLLIFGAQIDLHDDKSFVAAKLLWSLGALVLADWIFANTLTAINYYTIRMIEGYHWPPIIRTAACRMQIRRWRKLQNKISIIDRQWIESEAASEAIPRCLINQRNALKQALANQYPDKEHLILPTRFGNVVRAFETYPRVMYGLDGVPGWMRLLSVVSKESIELVTDAKANVDLFVNMAALSMLLVMLVTINLIISHDKHYLLYLFICILTCYSCFKLAIGAAMRWGAVVMAIFDTHLHKLSASLGYRLPSDAAIRRSFWERYSQAIIYHEPSFEEDYAAFFETPKE